MLFVFLKVEVFIYDLNIVDNQEKYNSSINRNIGDLVILPCSESKQSSYKTYKDVCTDNDRPEVGLTTFEGVWQSCCPNVKFMSPKTDVCPICEQHKDDFQSAMTETDS